MLIPRFEPTPLWWKRYAAFVAAVGMRDNVTIQQAVTNARAEATQAQPQVLQLVDLALTNPVLFFATFTTEQLKDKDVAKRAAAVLSFLPLDYRQTYKTQVSAAIVELETVQPHVATAIFGDEVTRALTDPEAMATATTLAQAEAQLLARIVIKQDYITALVQAGIVAADSVQSVMVDTLLMENAKTLERIDARVVASIDTLRHMYMLEHPDATLKDVHARVSELDALATTGPLRADSVLRAQRAEVGSVAGLITGAPFHNTLLSLSFWAVHEGGKVKDAQIAELRDMLEGSAKTSTGTCNYDTYLLPAFATSLFEKATKASAELQQLINIKAVCTRFPLVFFSARAADYSQDFIERVFKTYVTDATLRFQLFDNYVSSLGAAKFKAMTKLQVTLWYLLYETRRMTTLLSMQLLIKLYPAKYKKAEARVFVIQIQEHVRDGLNACESFRGECGEYCVKVKNLAGLHQCMNQLPNTLDVVNVPLLQTFAANTNIQDQYQISRLTNTRIPLPVDNAWVRQQAELYGLEKLTKLAPTTFFKLDQLVTMLCPAYTTTLLAWSMSSVKRLDMSSKVRQTLELLGANLLKQTSVPVQKQQAAVARNKRLHDALQDNPTLMNSAISFVNECHETWENVVNVAYSPELSTDIVMGAYNCQLMIDELVENNSTIYWLLNSTLTSLWKLLGLDTQTVSIVSPVDNKTFQFGVTGVKESRRSNLKVQLFALVAVTLTELALKIVVYFKSFQKLVNATVANVFSSTFKWICAQVYTMYDYSTRVLSPRLFEGWTDLLTKLVSIVPTSIWELPRKFKSLCSLVSTFNFRTYLRDIVMEPWSFVNSLTTAVRSNYVLSTSMLTTSMMAALWLFNTTVTGGAQSASAEAAAALNATLPLLQAALNSSTVNSVIGNNTQTLGVVQALVNLATNTTLSATEVNGFVQSLATSSVDVSQVLAETITTVLHVTTTDVAASATSSGMSVTLPLFKTGAEMLSQVPVGATTTAVSTYLAQSLTHLQQALPLPPVTTFSTAVSTYLVQMPTSLAAAAAPAVNNAVNVLVSAAANVTAVPSTWATALAPTWTSSELTSSIAAQLTNQLQCPLAAPLDIVQSAIPAPPVSEVMAALQTVNVTNPLSALTSNMTAEQITTTLQQVPTDLSLVIPVMASLAAAALIYFIDKRSNGALSGALARAASKAASSVGLLLSKAGEMFGLRAKKEEEAIAKKTIENSKYTKKQLTQLASKLQKSNAKENNRRRLAQEQVEATEARTRRQQAREREDALAAAMADESLQLREHEIQVLEAEIEEEEDVPPLLVIINEVEAHHVRQSTALLTLIDASADVALASGIAVETVAPLRASLQREVETLSTSTAAVVQNALRGEDVAQQLNDAEQNEASLQAKIEDEFAPLVAAPVVVAVPELPVTQPVITTPPLTQERRLEEFLQQFTRLVKLVHFTPFEEIDLQDETFDNVLSIRGPLFVDKTLFLINCAIQFGRSKQVDVLTTFATVWKWYAEKQVTFEAALKTLPPLDIQVFNAVSLLQYLVNMQANPNVQLQLIYLFIWQTCSFGGPIEIAAVNWETVDNQLLKSLFCRAYRDVSDASTAMLALCMWLITSGLKFDEAVQAAQESRKDRDVTLLEQLIMLSIFTTPLIKSEIVHKLDTLVIRDRLVAATRREVQTVAEQGETLELQLQEAYAELEDLLQNSKITGALLEKTSVETEARLAEKTKLAEEKRKAKLEELQDAFAVQIEEKTAELKDLIQESNLREARLAREKEAEAARLAEKEANLRIENARLAHQVAKIQRLARAFLSKQQEKQLRQAAAATAKAAREKEAEAAREKEAREEERLKARLAEIEAEREQQEAEAAAAARVAAEKAEEAEAAFQKEAEAARLKEARERLKARLAEEAEREQQEAEAAAAARVTAEKAEEAEAAFQKEVEAARKKEAAAHAERQRIEKEETEKLVQIKAAAAARTEARVAAEKAEAAAAAHVAAEKAEAAAAARVAADRKRIADRKRRVEEAPAGERKRTRVAYLTAQNILEQLEAQSAERKRTEKERTETLIRTLQEERRATEAAAAAAAAERRTQRPLPAYMLR